MPAIKRAATPPAGAMSAKKMKMKERDKRSERRSAALDQGQPLHSQEPRDHDGRLKHFPLLRLPAELRNSVYEYVFSDTEYNFSDHCVEEDITQCMETFNECNLGLIAASRQLHAETHLLLYKLATFNFYFKCPQEEWSWCVGRFVRSRTEEQRSAIGINMEVAMFDHDLGEKIVFY